MRRWAASFPSTDFDYVWAALDAGRGVVLAMPHSGNWDMAGVWLVQNYGTLTTVAERLKPESLYNRFIEYRESLGFELLPLTGGERPPFEVLANGCGTTGWSCLMADRDLTRSGVQVDFFGEPTRMPAGPAKLAIETGAALLPVHCWFEPRRLGLRVSIRRWTRHPATSPPSPRRWPTGSPATSPPTRPTGTCCSRSGWPTCRERSGAGGPEAGPADAHRDGLPVLVRRPRRRAVPCAATRRGDARPRA